MYARLGNSKSFIISDRGDLKTLKFKRLPLEVDEKTGMNVFQSFDGLGRATVHYMAIEVLRHFGKLGRIRVDSLEPEDIVFKDGNKNNNHVSNLGITEQAAMRLNLIGATGEHADKGAMPPPGDMADLTDEDDEDDDLFSDALPEDVTIEEITVDESVEVSEPDDIAIEAAVPKTEAIAIEANYHVVVPESGPFYDIADANGNSILEKKLNGKSRVLNYIKEHGIEVSNKEVLL